MGERQFLDDKQTDEKTEMYVDRWIVIVWPYSSCQRELIAKRDRIRIQLEALE